VVFDLDGTLVDSRRDLADSTNEMLAAYGAPSLPLDTVLSLVGEGAKVLVQRALAASGLDRSVAEALDRFREIYDRRLLVHTRPYDGIPEVVATLAADHPLAVLTNKPEAPTRRLLDAFALAPYFSWVVGGDSQYARKPDPAALRSLMAHAVTTPDRTMLVGDSMVDVETARRAGAEACVARYGFGRLRGEPGLDDVECAIDAPGDLIAMLQARRVRV